MIAVVYVKQRLPAVTADEAHFQRIICDSNELCWNIDIFQVHCKTVSAGFIIYTR